MNKIFSGIVFGCMFSLGVSGAAFADSLSVTPAHPTIVDSIRLTIIIPNWDCCTQYPYDSTLVTALGDTAVMLSYQYRMPNVCPAIACIDVPKLLGFKSKPLPAGTYSVWETKQLVCTPPLLCAVLPIIQKIGKFTVGAIRPDTVYVTPQQPTTLDSLTFLLFSTHHCCHTVYYDKTVSVNDTMIFLSYRYDDSLCAFPECFFPFSNITFSRGPLSAGRYSIYKVESPYCPPGAACPMIVTAPVLVGTVTVTSASGIRQTMGDRAPLRGNCLTVAGTSVSATIARSARVTLRAFDVRGALIGEVFNGWMPAGTRHFNMGTVFTKATARGTVLLVLTVDGVATADKTIIISR